MNYMYLVYKHVAGNMLCTHSRNELQCNHTSCMYMYRDSALATTKRKSDELGKEQDAYDDDFHR